MAKVTKESLERKISILECDKRTWGELSLNAEYQLEAYKMLLQRQQIGYLFIADDGHVLFSISPVEKGLTLIGPVYGDILK